MDKENVTVLGKFYMKNGIIIEEKVILENSSRVEINAFVGDTIEDIKCAFKEDSNQISFGSTTFRLNEIIAAKIIEEK